MASPRLRFHPTRILALVGIGPIFMLVLGVAAYFRYKLAQAGIAGWLGESFSYQPIRQFGIAYVLRILLPVYLVAGLVAWFLTLPSGLLAKRDWAKDWRSREALGIGLSALLWVHLVLWWQVPSTLWNIPILRSIPFVLLFPLLLIGALAYPCFWLSRMHISWTRRGGVLALWALSWSCLAWLPEWLPRPKPASRGGDQACKVLILGVDGLRSDVCLANTGQFKGIPYRNAYTVIPATRMLWHILWGGDPMTYTIGHVGPSIEEFMRFHDLKLLKEASHQGLKPRFYIDDGGTIGLAGRRMDLDDALAPAAGWENFINSNLASSFPLYAVWENWFKPFPTTNPWARLDAGVREALRLGRGSGWVMFHSCLAHQPIYLSRPELAELGRWWTLKPISLEPLAHIGLVKPQDVLAYDARRNPFRAYEIRMQSILRAWQPIWNTLDRDPQYGKAVRILFSDHGERFHYVANGFQLQGVHGYNLDPWECRASLLISGPGFSDQTGVAPRDCTISLLGICDGVRRILKGEGPFDAAYFEQARPIAPIRYHTLGTSAFGQDPLKFKVEPEHDLATNTYLAPGGIWFTEYTRNTEARAKDASIAYGEGPELHVFKPLETGGAEEFDYRGYDLLSERAVDEKTFLERKAYVEKKLAE